MKILNKISISLFGIAALLSTASCDSIFLDHDPQDQRTDEAYFTEPAHFKEYTTSFYAMLQGWNSSIAGYATLMDQASDLSAYYGQNYELGHGTVTPPVNDSRWDNAYSHIRQINLLFDNRYRYTGNPADIERWMAEAAFFRAYNYYYLLQFFGGVPILKTAPDVGDAILYASRNDRYEVVDFILSDLQRAIDGLPAENTIEAEDKGRISRQGAQAFKARVLLDEATWRKYVGTTTDFEGSGTFDPKTINEYLEESVALNEEVINSRLYSIWNHNDIVSMSNMSYRYLFCLEGINSNPGALDRSTNKEYIIKQIYDNELKPGGTNVNQTINKFTHSRKLMDMFVCTDGLPISISPLFEGYAGKVSEFENRDFRMKSITNYSDLFNNKVLNGTSGYGNMKFISVSEANKESADKAVIRLAEVYLNYVEALWELNGDVSDEALDKTINIERERAGIAPLSKALVEKIKTLSGTSASAGEVLRDEIRRERAVELYEEGFRFHDLCRWGIAEQEINQDRLGTVVGGANYPTVFRDKFDRTSEFYTPNSYTNGEGNIDTKWGQLACVRIESAQNINFKRTHYLQPIPTQQRALNPNLKQNPGY